MAIATINPATGETVRTFDELGEAELQEKIALAHERWRTYRTTGFQSGPRTCTPPPTCSRRRPTS